MTTASSSISIHDKRNSGYNVWNHWTVFEFGAERVNSIGLGRGHPQSSGPTDPYLL
jgi:hypothetical protein